MDNESNRYKQNEVLEVEEIFQKKFRLGKVEYYVKWKGYPNEDNTWEPVENIMNYQDLIEEFEENFRKKESAAARYKYLKRNNLIDKKMFKKPKQKDGFARGYSPERIIGATKSRHGLIKFLMKWKNIDEADYVLAKEANTRCPQIVIKFYQNNLQLYSKDDDKTENESISS